MISHADELRSAVLCFQVSEELTVSSPKYLTHTLSTITSPVFSEVIIVYRDYDVGGLPTAESRATPYYMHSRHSAR